MNYTGILTALLMLGIVGTTIGMVVYENGIVERCNERGGALLRQPGWFNYRCVSVGGFNV